jgi:polysaccharide biosynthesis protein PslH
MRYEKHRQCFAGRVETLDWYYQNCRAVLLPVIEGQGLAIKTVEALSYGKPVVGMPLAFRGFLSRFDAGKFPGFVQNARSFRKAMSDIGDGLHAAADWDVIKHYEALFSSEVYLAKYRDFLEKIEVPIPHGQSAPPVPENVHRLLPIFSSNSSA